MTMLRRLFVALVLLVVCVDGNAGRLHMKSSRAGGGTAITLSVTPSRTSGVAPLYVFFDTTATTSTATTRPFQDVELRWNYGDSGAGTWSVGTRPGVNSKNSHYGPLGAHVFETPGTYTVTVVDAAGTVSYTSPTITVDDPNTIFTGAKTVCFSQTSTYTNCPAGATHGTTSSDLATALGAATSGNTVRRLLFHAGETWTAAAPISFAIPGPGTIGSYDTGANPKFKAAATGFALDDVILSMSNAGTPTMADWRMMDIKFDGTAYSPAAFNATGLGGGLDQMTFLRITTDSVRLGIIADPGLLDLQAPTHIWDQIAIVDLTVSNPTAGNASYGVFMGGERFFFSGAHIDGTSSHNTRFPYLGKAILSNNDVWNPGSTEHSFKIHAPQFGAAGKAQSGVGGGYSRWVDVSDNLVKSKPSGNAYQIAIGVENDGTQGGEDQRLLDVVVERNWQIFGTGTTVGQFFFCAEVTSRNNIINMDGGADHIGIKVARRGPATQTPDQVRLYNNSIYTNDTAAGSFVATASDGVATNLFSRNNLGYAANDSAPVMVSGANFTSSNNSANPRTSPGFAGALTSLSGWALTGGSYAIGAGLTSSTTPVFSDIIFANRPAATALDLGAVKF